MVEKAYLNALNQFYFIGPKRMEQALESFSHAEEIWHASEKQLKSLPLWVEVAEEFVVNRKNIDVSEEWNKVKEAGVEVITKDSSRYPELLKQIYDAPYILYAKGEIKPEEVCISIVGSRKCTSYGQEIAYELGRELAARGVTVVSGMALGIDSFAHKGALQKGRTIAILGSGADVVYPRKNQGLYTSIKNQGVVVSEFPLGTEPVSYNFPRRNRIISGMCLGTVVVEAPEKSGALITADYALEQGREVFAVPGSVRSPYSKGCHKLIKEGARMVEGIDDVLEEIKFITGSTEEKLQLGGDTGTAVELSEDEEGVLAVLPYDALHIDSIIEKSGFSASRVGSILLNLELKGWVKQLPGKYFLRS